MVRLIHNPCVGYGARRCQNMLSSPNTFRCQICFENFNNDHPTGLEINR